MIIFRMKFSDGAEKDLKIYNKKWKSLMHYLNSIPRTRKTYERLKEIRDVYQRDFILVDVIERVEEIDSIGARLLMDVSVLYDKAPYDLRCFIISVLGVKVC